MKNQKCWHKKQINKIKWRYSNQKKLRNRICGKWKKNNYSINNYSRIKKISNNFQNNCKKAYNNSKSCCNNNYNSKIKNI